MTSSAFDANGNRILRVSRREANGADVADVETAERVIQVSTCVLIAKNKSFSSKVINFHSI